MNEMDQRRKEIYERKKKLYDTNKELLEIDPNLILQIKLNWMDYFLLINFASLIAWFQLKRINSTKKFFFISGMWLISQYHITKYYFTIYPHILLKNTKQILEQEKFQDPIKTL